MNSNLKIVIWNANGLIQHSTEVRNFLTDKNIDIMLISETHFSERTHLRIPNYKIYNANHPSGNARGGAAIIIKSDISHFLHRSHEENFLQSVAIIVRDKLGPLCIAAVYLPPNQTINKQQFDSFFDSLEKKFIVGGDFNAKHTHWGSRLITPRGRELLKSMQSKNLHHVSTGEPTYWPTDPNKTPDLIDFCICKGIPNTDLSIRSSLDLSSDHSPLLLDVNTDVFLNNRSPNLHNKNTDWSLFRSIVEDTLNTDIALKDDQDIEIAIEHFNNVIQNASWRSTPSTCYKKTAYIDRSVQQLLQEKRRLRRIWQITRQPNDKRRLNEAAKRLKETLNQNKNEELEMYLKNLSPHESTDYSLWKATRKMNGPTATNPPLKTANGSWARSDCEKANEFAMHLKTVFKPYPSKSTIKDTEIGNYLETPFQMDRPIPNTSPREIRWLIKTKINSKKAPGYDLITGKVLKELPDIAITFITHLFNAIIRSGYYPSQWKVAQIILIPKPGKPAELVSSYRPISLLPVLSKLFERVLLKRINKIIKQNSLVPNHQFGFRQHHSTVEQINRVYQYARNSLEKKQYCTAVFIDVTQAFDKIWHQGLLYKLKKMLLHSFFPLLKSYVLNRYFMVKINNHCTEIHPIESGVPQGSVLGPTLYALYTSDLPTSPETFTATFADDTVIMSKSSNPARATLKLQANVISIGAWLDDWRIKANETKSTQITFALRNEDCPPIVLNGSPLPQSVHVKYLGVHFDRRLTWRHHIFTKRKQLGLKLRSMYWLLGPNSKVTLENKVLLYKTILKPIWTYGISVWGTAAKSNLDILQRFQSKTLRMCVGAPWFVTNDTIHHDLSIPTVYETIRETSCNYRQRLANHPNPFAANLVTNTPLYRRLRRTATADLPFRTANN